MGCNIKEAAKTFNVEYATREEEYREGDDMLYMVYFKGTSKTVCNRMFIFPADKFLFAE